MTPEQIRRRRLEGQHLLHPRLTDPAEVVHGMLAMQAQEYAMAKWAIALRMRGSSTDAQVESAFDEGRILRTHVLRPTWHFVSPGDIRLVLQVTAARVNQANAFIYRSRGLAARFTRFNAALSALLAGGGHLTREEIRAAAPADLVEGDGVLMSLLMMRAELDGVVCSGPRRGTQLTYAVFEDRVPPQPEVSHDQALAELCRRYVATRGPATTTDLTTWSALTVAQVKRGLAPLGDAVRTVEVDGAAYHLLAGQPSAQLRLEGGLGRTQLLGPDDLQQRQHLRLVRAGFGGVDDDGLVGLGKVHGVAVERDRTQLRMVDGLAVAAPGRRGRLLPLLPELRAELQVGEETPQVGVVRVACEGGPQVGDRLRRRDLSLVDAERHPSGSPEKALPGQVAMPGRQQREVTHEGGRHGVPGKDVALGAEHHGRVVLEPVEQAQDAGADQHRDVAVAWLGDLRKLEELAPLVVAEPQRTGQ